jgi:serine/threonine protein kinase
MQTDPEQNPSADPVPPEATLSREDRRASVGESREFQDIHDNFGLTPQPRAKLQLVDPLLGADLGGFKILRLIGEGGMGRVYEARQAKPDRTVAVKVIRQGIVSEKTMRRFEREAEFLGKLQHPGIAQILVVGTYSSDVGEVPFYVMEFLANAKPITNYVHEKNLPHLERLKLFKQVCEAVSHGHDRGIVHRDLKPGNILIDTNGTPKIIDFGVARSTDSDLQITSMKTDTGQVVGTVQYMSPEQFGENPDDLDARVDVYSLGVVLYEMLAGVPPYDVKKKGIHEAARIVCEKTPDVLHAKNTEIPEAISGVVHRCLQKDRTKRYFTAGELVEDVQRVLDGQPVSPAAARSWHEESPRNPAAIKLWATLTSILGFITFVAVLDSRWGSVTDYAFAAGIGFLTCIPGHLLLRALYPGLRTPLNFDLSWFDGIVITAWLVFASMTSLKQSEWMVLGGLFAYSTIVVPIRNALFKAVRASQKESVT